MNAGMPKSLPALRASNPSTGRTDHLEVVGQAGRAVKRIVLGVEHVDDVPGELLGVTGRIDDDRLAHRQRPAREAVAGLPQSPAFVQVQQRLGLKFQDDIPNALGQQPVGRPINGAVPGERPVQDRGRRGRCVGSGAPRPCWLQAGPPACRNQSPTLGLLRRPPSTRTVRSRARRPPASPWDPAATSE